MNQSLLLLSLLTLLLSTLAVETQQSQKTQQTQQQQYSNDHFKGTPAHECSVSIVGAGLSGVYSAWRLATAEDSTIDPTTLCLFEREETHGGVMMNVDVAGKNYEMGVSYYFKGMPFVRELLGWLGIEDKCAFTFEMKEDVLPEVEAGAAQVQEQGVDQEVQVGAAQAQETAQEIEVGAAQVQETAQEIDVGAAQVQKQGADQEIDVGAAQAQETAQEIDVGAAQVQEQGADQEIDIGAAQAQETAQEIDVGAAEAEESEAELPPQQQQKQQQKGGRFFQKKTRNVDTERLEGNKPQLQQQTKFFDKGQQQQEQQVVTEMEAEPAVVEECPKISIDYWFVRNKLVTSGTRVDALPLYNFVEKWDKVPDLFHLAFKAALHGKVDTDQVFALSRSDDINARWEAISPLIESIIFGEPVTFNDIPLNQLSLRMILEDQNFNREWLQSALDLSDFVGLEKILDLSFEHVAVELLRYFSSGSTEMRKVTSSNGMRTIVDRMIEDLNSKGVRIFYKHTLDHVESMHDGSLALKFRELEGHIKTEQLVLAISAKNLKSLKHSEIFNNISPDASEMLGSLKPIKAFEGILFYERPWWKDLGLTGVAKTDNRFEMISYLSEDGCEEVKRCGLRFLSLKDAESFNTIDLVNRIDETSIITRISEDEASRTPSEKYSLTSLQRLVDDIHSSIPGYTDMNIGLPVEAVFANWATDERMNLGSYAVPSRIRLSDRSKLALSPISGLPIYLVNSDYAQFHRPASSLISGERLVSSIFGLMQPEWISNQAEYNHLTKLV